MTNEEKQILLNDLKYRLYTKTQCQCIWADAAKNGSAGVINELDTYLLDELEMIGNPDCEYMFSDIKPFLRPMSSMTKEEREELIREFGADIRDEDNGRHTEEYGYVLVYHNFKEESWFIPFEAIDFLNTHHFDYRGLIEKGLALPAPK